MDGFFIFSLALTQAVVTHFMFLSDFHPAAITPIFFKWEREADLDPYQFVYQPNGSAEDAIMALHAALTHLDNSNSYIKMLLTDFSSAFTINPSKEISKFSNISIINWGLDYLTNRP